ncbi:MAG TPA: hypothetical protein GXZ68_08355 [Firmicutes bacterium]|nr:hypothetical protein [Bacillota bacterium]
MRIDLNEKGFCLDGEPTILLTASLFYFRIPRMLWSDRLAKVKAAKYNAIDVYFPWNYHEPREGCWDFSGEKDVAAFLDLASEAGLRVLARPGPYICSEWDGGALPAWLYPKSGLELRQNNELFLGYVEKWYQKILGILKDYQFSKGGPVIGVQLDNELDFFDCHDRVGYIGALRDVARAAGITVPLTACAGEGDLTGATGEVSGVIPTGNFYPGDRKPGVERLVQSYVHSLAKRDLPLIVTETGRSHFLLRRLLAAGVKGLGPFLQVSGGNYGFYHAVNDWKTPFAFLLTNSDFGGMIDSAGRLRNEFYEGRLLGFFLESFRQELAEARSEAPNTVRAEPGTGLGAPNEAGEHEVFSLLFGDGSRFIFATNLTDTEYRGTIEAEGASFPRSSELEVAPKTVKILPYNLPVLEEQDRLRILYSTSELFCIKQQLGGRVLLFQGSPGSSGEFALAGNLRVIAADCRWEEGPEAVVFTYSHQETPQSILLRSGSEFLHCVLLTTEMAGKTWFGGPDGEEYLVMEADWLEGTRAKIWSGGSRGQVYKLVPGKLGIELLDAHPASLQTEDVPIQSGLLQSWSILDLWDWLQAERKQWQGPPLALEELGQYQGLGFYSPDLSGTDLTDGEHFLYMAQSADIVSVYADGSYLTTLFPGGNGSLVPLGASLGETLLIAAEIWGHSNFDHRRVPALALGSMRGLQHKAALVRTLKGIQETYQGGEWLGTFARQPEQTTYLLELPCEAAVEINGEVAAWSNGFSRHMDLSSHVQEKNVIKIRGLDSAQPQLFVGQPLVDWEYAGLSPPLIHKLASIPRGEPLELEYPLEFAAGRVYVLVLPLRPAEGLTYLAFQGRNCHITAYLGPHLAGRLFVHVQGQPEFTGGTLTDRLYLPEPWLEAGEIRLVIQALGPAAQLDRVGLVTTTKHE